MKFQVGYNITEEDIRANEKYLKILKTIKPKELTTMFANKAQIKLQKYNKVFEKLEKTEGEGFFSGLNSVLNRNQLRELTIKFFEGINIEWAKETEGIFEGINPNVQLSISEDKENLWANHSKFITGAGGGIIIPEDMLESLKKDNPEEYNKIMEMNKEKVETYINISLTGCLNDIYNLVHELTHYFTFRDTATERIFSEVAPQCMERVLDDFLLQLSEEELNKNELKKEELSRDIRKRRIISFASRYKSTKNFNKENKNDTLGYKEEEYLSYFLAQFFQAQFRKNNEKDKKKKIIKFIEELKNDNFEMATKTFGVNWTNRLKRGFYVEDMIQDIKKDLEVKHEDNKINANNNEKKEREQR